MAPAFYLMTALAISSLAMWRFPAPTDNSACD
jgi:hypothetical protein